MKQLMRALVILYLQTKYLYIYNLLPYQEITINMKRLQLIAYQINSNDEMHTYSVPVTPKNEGETPIHRKVSHRDGLYQVPSSITSLADIWDRSAQQFSDHLFIQDYSFKLVDEMACRVGSWILSNNHKLFYLYCSNSPYWTITDVATWNYGFTNVPLYDTLGPEAFSHILKITQGTLIFTTKNLLNGLHIFLSKNKFNINEVCLFDQITLEDRNKIQSLEIKVTSFKDALNFKNIAKRPILNLQNQLSYAFTSGTTGLPKGVVYTHKMVIATCNSMLGHYELNTTDVHMSFLPIAHIFERFISWLCIFFGANIRYTKYPITQIFKDFAQIRPTTIGIVPRLLNKFYPIMKALAQKDGNFSSVRALFGGRLKRLVTGSAPVSPAILAYFSQALEADIRQAYGQTQTTGAAFVIYKGQTKYGHIGGPNNSIQFKLVDVPQMNYFTDNQQPKGEIYLRGPVIFNQYFKDPVNTAETIDKDGWDRTGDIGQLLPNGALKIIDRKKNIFKLQQGEYIAPEKIQNIYARCKFVAQSFVYGDSMKDFSVAIIHPNLENLPIITRQLGISEKDIKKLCANDQIVNFIYDEITKQGKTDGLLGFEMVKKIKLWHEPFQQTGIVTTTMKLQRYIAKKKFQKQIKQLYS